MQRTGEIEKKIKYGTRQVSDGKRNVSAMEIEEEINMYYHILSRQRKPPLRKEGTEEVLRTWKHG